MFFNNFLGIKIPPKWDFPGGPGVKNLPSSAGDVGSIPVWENKTPYTAGLVPKLESLCSPRVDTAKINKTEGKIKIIKKKFF